MFIDIKRLLPTIAFFFIIFLLFFSKNSVADDNKVITLDTALKTISHSSTPPNFSQSKVINLPDHWEHEPKGFYGSVWYELNIEHISNIKQQWAIYLPEINMNAEVWVNETLLGSGGNMQAPISRYWHSPLMFVFSPADLKPQNNKVIIRVVTYANEFGQLGQVLLGERNIINKLYQKSLFNNVNIHIFSGLLAAVYFFLMALVWYKRKDPVFFWGALVCGSWSISSLNLYVIDPIFSELIWEKLMQISMGWIPLLFFFFIRRLNGRQYSFKFEGIILTIIIIINLALLSSSETHLFFISKNFHLFSMFWGILSIVFIFYSWIKYRQSSQLAMVIAFTLIAMSGCHDILVQNKIIESGEAFWLDYSVPIILLMIGYLMVTRFLIAVKSSEKLNHELESRVNKAHKKIEANYEKILTLETEQASSNERERIYRNLHDDMGAKLLSLVYQAESDETGQLARDAMKDLRAIVSKKPKKKHLLTETLEKWHQESITRCEEAHFNFAWEQSELPSNYLLNSEDYQNIQRLQSEAISNVLKHSSGNKIIISIKQRFNCLQITVFDNGDYANLNHWIEGRGISSMRFRIKQLKGKIHWQAHQHKGGTVRWIMPLSINV